VVKNGIPEIIVNANGSRATPTCAAFTDQEMLVGEAAAAQAHANPEQTVNEVFAMVGKTYKEVAKEAANWNFKVTEGPQGVPVVEVTMKGKKHVYSAAELVGLVLNDIKGIADAYCGVSVSEAVIAVPVAYTATQREALRAIAEAHGLRVLRFVNEPVAAAIAHDLDLRSSSNAATSTNNLVVDVGGSSTDVSLLSITDGIITVKQSAHVAVGGNALDAALVEYAADIFEKKHNVSIRQNKRSMILLRNACEKAKRGLTLTSQAKIEVDSLFDSKELYSSVTRAKFDSLISDVVKKTIETATGVLTAAGLTPADVSKVILIGGSAKVVKVRQAFEAVFGVSKLESAVAPEDAVTFGAAIEASLLAGKDAASIAALPVIQVSSLDISVEVADGMVQRVLPAGSPLPTSVTLASSNSEDNQTAVVLKVGS
jgi:molecular chaperone DnaK (HSP70)